MSKPSALEAYQAQEKRVKRLLRELSENVDKFTQDGSQKAFNWGHVGSLEHVAARLEEINECFGG